MRHIAQPVPGRPVPPAPRRRLRLPGGLVTRVVAGSVALAIAVVAVFIVLLVTVNARRDATQGAERSDSVLTHTFVLQNLVVDTETGARGYLLTGNRVFLQPYTRALRLLPGRLEQLERAVRDDHAQAARARAIAEGVGGYLDRWAQPVVAEGPSRDRAHEGRLLVTGKRMVDGLRARFARFDSVQEAAAKRHNAHADHLTTLSLWIGLGGVGLAVVLMLLFAIYTMRLVLPLRGVAATAGRLARGDLDARVKADGVAEMAQLATAFNHMADALQDSRAELEAQNEELAAQQHELQSVLTTVAQEKARVERFHAFSQALAGHTEIEELGATVLAVLCKEGGADVGVIHVRNPSADVYERLVTRGVPSSRIPPLVRGDDGVAGRALVERRPVTIAAGDAGLPVAVLGGEQPARHQVAVPLLAGGRPTAVVVLGRVEDRPFTDDELTALARLGDQAAVALARARMQRQTERSLRTVQAVLDATPDPIALVGLDETVAFENRPMAELRTAAGGEAGADLAFDAPGDDPLREVRDELGFEHGRRTLLRYAAPMLDDGETIIGRIVVLRDVSAEREAERLKDEFFALVSHELRTPLTSIIGYLEMTLEEDEDLEPLDPQRRRFLEVIDRNASRLLRLVGDLLFVAQVEAGTLTLTRTGTDLARIVGQAVEAARPRAVDAQVELTVEAPETLPLAAADGDRLGQMVDNLVANAIKFTPAGGRVAVSAVEGADGIEVSVSDTGVGIAPADQARLFERFYRTADAEQTGVPGVGLGLTIAQAIAEGHGGRIEVDSMPGAGTTFRVRLPRRRRDEPRSRRGATPAAA